GQQGGPHGRAEILSAGRPKLSGSSFVSRLPVFPRSHRDVAAAVATSGEFDMKPIGRWLCATMASLAFTATALAQANDAPAESEPKVERSANPISGASETAPAASDASSPVDECLNAGSMAPADIFARCVLASDSEPDNIEVLR